MTLTVNPKKAVLKKLKTAKGRKLTVSWNKDTTVTGYEVQCALKKNFKTGLKKTTIKKAGTASTTFKKLTKNKKYYAHPRIQDREGEWKIRKAYRSMEQR